MEKVEKGAGYTPVAIGRADRNIQYDWNTFTFKRIFDADEQLFADQFGKKNDTMMTR